MYSLWYPLDDTFLPHDEVCPVCPGEVIMSNPSDLHYHLNNDSHKLRESIVLDIPDNDVMSFLLAAVSHS